MSRGHHQPAVRPRRHRLKRDQSGAAMVEFALVVGLFVFMLYGLISFGMILATKQRITNAAAEGARAAVGSTPANAASVATARVATALGAPGAYTATYNADACPAVPAGPKCIEVTITYDLQNHPIVPPAPGLGLVTPNTITSTAIVQYA